jgi:hypothetical protein
LNRKPAPRRPWLSLLGAALAALYLAAFVVGYVIYLQNIGQWLPDLTLLLIALPFTFTMNALTNGAFSMTGDETGKVIAAVLFCCALAYLGGAIIEWILRRLWRMARSSLLPAKRG